MRKMAFLTLLVLAGCASEAERRAEAQQVAYDVARNRTEICVEGASYYVFQSSYPGYDDYALSVTPALQPDGKPRPCQNSQQRSGPMESSATYDQNGQLVR